MLAAAYGADYFEVVALLEGDGGEFVAAQDVAVVGDGDVVDVDAEGLDVSLEVRWAFKLAFLAVDDEGYHVPTLLAALAILAARPRAARCGSWLRAIAPMTATPDAPAAIVEGALRSVMPPMAM